MGLDTIRDKPWHIWWVFWYEYKRVKQTTAETMHQLNRNSCYDWFFDIVSQTVMWNLKFCRQRSSKSFAFWLNMKTIIISANQVKGHFIHSYDIISIEYYFYTLKWHFYCSSCGSFLNSLVSRPPFSSKALLSWVTVGKFHFRPGGGKSHFAKFCLQCIKHIFVRQVREIG